MTTNSIIYWVLGVLVVLALSSFLVGYWIFVPQTFSPSIQRTDTTPTQSKTSTTVTSVPGGNTITIALSDGARIAVKDFLHDGNTEPDAVNPGYYFVAGAAEYCLANGHCPTGASSNNFKVIFNEKTGSFIISLTAEPLGEARQAVERMLIQRLNINETNMCRLNYGIYVSFQLNDALAGKNLGFSFCPGATDLSDSGLQKRTQ